MAITLLVAVNSTATLLEVSDPDFTTRRFPFLTRLEDELVRIAGGSFHSRAADGTYLLQVERGAENTTRASHAAAEELEPVVPLVAPEGGSLEMAQAYAAAGHSNQTVAADLELGADVGDVGTNPKFLAAIMGNVLNSADLTKAGAYIAGVIAALSVTGARASQYQIGALLGVLMDGVTVADGIVVAVVDGSDPSSVTRATAAFAARINNNNAGSGVDYGLDLLGAANANFTGGGVALAIAKALLRSPHNVCVLESADVPVDGTTGDNFAGKGSICVDYTHGEAYINTGTITDSVWKKITHA